MTKKLIALVALLGAFFTASAQAQLTNWWRIVSGPGRGIVIKSSGFCGFGPCVSDPFVGAFGAIALGHFSDCPCSFADGHYHGTLFGEEDPAEDSCGWGCVYEIPCSTLQAAEDLRSQIDDIGRNFDPDLADKLDSIVDLMEDAALDGCYSVVDRLADAFGDELEAYFFETGYSPGFDNLIRGITEFVEATYDDMDLPYIHIPTIPLHAVRLLDRVGSGSRSLLMDAGPRINARVGQMISLSALGSGTGIFRWEYKWKGAEIGALPSGTGAAFLNNRISVFSAKKTSVRISVSLKYADFNKLARDTIMVNFQ